MNIGLQLLKSPHTTIKRRGREGGEVSDNSLSMVVDGVCSGLPYYSKADKREQQRHVSVPAIMRQ